MVIQTSVDVTLPQYVYDKYMTICNSDIIQHKTLNDDTMTELQTHLNDVQPQTDEDAMTRSFIRGLCRKNPAAFCQYLVKAHMPHLILWTEAKCIVSHFNLRGAVYIKWNEDHYECSLHRNMTTNGVTEHPALQSIINSVNSSIKQNDTHQQSRHKHSIKNTVVQTNQRQPMRGRRGERGRSNGRGRRSHVKYTTNNFPKLN